MKRNYEGTQIFIVKKGSVPDGDKQIVSKRGKGLFIISCEHDDILTVLSYYIVCSTS